MNVADVIKTGLKYPFSDYKTFIVIGVLFLLTCFGFISFQGVNDRFFIFRFIFSIVLLIIILGYSLDVINEGLKNSFSMPAYNDGNLGNGVKVFLLEVIYDLIPLIIMIVVAFFSGLFTTLPKLFSYIFPNGAVAANGTSVIGAVPNNLLFSVSIGIIITLIVGVIFYVLFMLFAKMGLVRLAETGSMKEGLNFSNIVNRIASVGWGRFIGYNITVLIISALLLLVFAFLVFIPFVGSFIGLFLIMPYIFLFDCYSLGLIVGDN